MSHTDVERLIEKIKEYGSACMCYGIGFGMDVPSSEDKQKELSLLTEISMLCHALYRPVCPDGVQVDLSDIEGLISLLEKHGMQRANFQTDGSFGGIWYIQRLVLERALQEAGGFNEFIKAYVREKLHRELGLQYSGSATQ